MSQSRATLLQDRVQATWLAVCLAGLPHLFYALTKYVPGFLVRANPGNSNTLLDGLFGFMQSFPSAWWLLTRLAPADYWSAARVFVEVVYWTFALSVLVAALIAWRRRWPRWSGTTLGYVFIVLFETSLMLWRDDRRTGFNAMVVLIGYVILIAWLTRRDPLAGLLSILPLYPMFVWWTAMDGVRGAYGEALYYIFIGLVMALAVGVVVRRSSFTFGLGLLVIAVFTLGLGVGYATTYYSNMFAPPLPTPGAVLRSALGGLLAFALIGLPMWLTLGWGWARRRSAALSGGTSG